MRRIELKVTHTNGVYPCPPEYATVGSAGLDLVSLEEKTLLPKESGLGIPYHSGDGYFVWQNTSKIRFTKER